MIHVIAYIIDSDVLRSHTFPEWFEKTDIQNRIKWHKRWEAPSSPPSHFLRLFLTWVQSIECCNSPICIQKWRRRKKKQSNRRLLHFDQIITWNSIKPREIYAASIFWSFVVYFCVCVNVVLFNKIWNLCISLWKRRERDAKYHYYMAGDGPCKFTLSLPIPPLCFNHNFKTYRRASAIHSIKHSAKA